MPVLERDPWRVQYFDDVPCPDHISIPTDDPDCWLLFPAQRWIYDKLRIAQTQGLNAGPHGVAPEGFPVFSKPIINLKGMGIGSRVIRSAAEMEHDYQPGHMWVPLLTGEHVSTDCAVEDGRVAWGRHATGVPSRRLLDAAVRAARTRLPPSAPRASARGARHAGGEEPAGDLP